ncbi:MAG: cyclic nucleotide-binding domain-containing protein [Gammaproteobacteria bacterium]|nr:cyclic nucleotide-binding domain-containing protein [Gammaproteobacteria bacterium]
MNVETNGNQAAVLKDSPLTVEMNESEVEALARLIRVRDLADGDVLVPEGSRDTHLHGVVSGIIEVATRADGGGWNILHVLRPGDLVGELSFMDGEPRFAALIASGPTRVFTLDRSEFESLLNSHPHVVYKAMRAIMRVSHGIQRRLSLQMREMEHYFLKTGGRY